MSPGGKFIVAIGYTAKPGTNNAVFVVPASGGELRQLTPDGRRFFYMSEAAGKKGYGIYVYDKASGDITLFADHTADQSPPRWSRDGKTAAWWATRKTERQAWVMENFLPKSKAGE